MYPQISDAEVGDMPTSTEVNFDEVRAGLCESGDGFIVYGLDVAEVDQAEEFAVVGKGEHALWRYCSTASEIDLLQAFACPCEGGNSFVGHVHYACEVDGGKIRASQEHYFQRLIGNGAAPNQA